MFKKILIAVVAICALIVVGLVAVAAMQPSEFHVERSATMAAPDAKIFAQVNDFHKWEDWSPWLELDPAAKNSFEGSSSGEGAIFRWAGNADVGEGSMTITESRPNDLVRIDLHFVKPFEDTAITQFTLKDEGDQTAVTWSMDGKNNLLAKIFCLFMDMDEMIGSKYEKGLANIKAIVEAAPTSDETPSTELSPQSET
jgi:hypothetical protein